MKKLDIPKNWLHPPALTEAASIQRELADKVITEDHFSTIKYIGGMDVSNNRFDPEKMIHAAIVILDQQNLTLLETACASQQQQFPYVPGFLGFREAPALVEAYQKLTIKPDIILVDGHGISHPRGLGIASHIGVLLDCPTIGVAKSILVGKPESVLNDAPGSKTYLRWHDKKIACVLRTKTRALPLIISSGHKISLESAVAIVKRCLTKYRLPEPTRQAHLAANVCRRGFDRQKN